MNTRVQFHKLNGVAGKLIPAPRVSAAVCALVVVPFIKPGEPGSAMVAMVVGSWDSAGQLRHSTLFSLS